MQKFLRQTWSGHIYAWTDKLAQRPDMEPYEYGPQHHMLVPASPIEIVARGTLTVESEEQPKLTEMQELGQRLLRRGRRAAA